MSNESRRLGSIESWLVSRVVQVVLLALAASSHAWQLNVAFLALFALVTYWYYPLAIGTADDDGITFRRYLTSYRASWKQVLRADWTPGKTTVALILATPRGLSEKVEFTVVSNIWQAWKVQTHGWTPEIVTWVMARVADR